MKFRIPSQFECGGRTIKVEIVETLPSDSVGEWLQASGVIRLEKQSPDSMAQTFWHEAFHAVCDTYGNTKLGAKEDTVERLSQGIWQAIKTAQ